MGHTGRCHRGDDPLVDRAPVLASLGDASNCYNEGDGRVSASKDRVVVPGCFGDGEVHTNEGTRA